MKTVENADEQAVNKRLRKKAMTLKLLLRAGVAPNETLPDRTALLPKTGKSLSVMKKCPLCNS